MVGVRDERFSQGVDLPVCAVPWNRNLFRVIHKAILALRCTCRALIALSSQCLHRVPLQKAKIVTR